jgi:hypothetical protein
MGVAQHVRGIRLDYDLLMKGRNVTDDSVVGMKGKASGTAGAQATIDSRYSFGSQFLRGAAMFARSARQLEAVQAPSISDDLRADHRAFVAAAIMQSTAGLEAEISEIVMHGPGFHLGTTGVDAPARDFLAPLEPLIDREQSLDRYQTVLHLLRKPQLDRGAEPFQSAALLVRLRNELTHYKSQWVSDMTTSRLLKTLEQRRFTRPAFVPESASFFPHGCLVADCAVWAVASAHAFLRAFYSQVGVSCSLDYFKPPLP